MEFMRHQGSLEEQAIQRLGAPVAEMAAAFEKAGFERQKAEHLVTSAIGGDKPLAENHISAALPENLRTARPRTLHA